MDKRYDLFELPSNGLPLWVGSASTLLEAKQKMEQMGGLADGRQYFVRDFLSGTVVAHSAEEKAPAVH